MDAAFQVGFDKGRADGKNPRSLPAGHSALDALGFIHCQYMSKPKFLLYRAAVNTLIPHLVFMLADPQEWYLAVGLIEPYKFSMDSCLDLAQVPLEGIMNNLVV